MRSSRVSTILAAAREMTVRAHGATPAAAAYLIARFARERHAGDPGSVTVILCADGDAALELAADLEALSAALPEREGEPPILPCLLPTWEQSPYSPIEPSLRTRHARVAALAALQAPASDAPRVVVTSLAALSQATAPPAALRDHTVPLKVGASAGTREDLARRLTAGGYGRVDTVEDPGTFGVRGEIVDVFVPGHDRPLRIELFGDEVERIRRFDPSTQRTLEPALAETSLPPAREVLLGAGNAGRVRERVKQRADDLGIPRPLRDPLIAAISSGSYPSHSDAWAPFAYETAACALDYLPDATAFVFHDEHAVFQRWDEFRAEQKKVSTESDGAARVAAPPPAELFAWGPDREAFVRERTPLYLDRLEMAAVDLVGKDEDALPPEPGEEPSGPRHQISVLAGALDKPEEKIPLWLKQGFRVVVLAPTPGQLERTKYLLSEKGFYPLTQGPVVPAAIHLRVGALSQGFRWPSEGLAVLTESELLGTKPSRKKRAEKTSAARDWSGLQALSDLAPGDAVVHVDHGIGRYQGLVRLDLAGAPSDFLMLEYANRDKLYLPVYRLNVIQKYAGVGAQVALDRLGAVFFAKAKEKVKEAVKRLAIDLVKLYAERKIRPGLPLSPRDAEYREFEASFAFDETPDQLKAIDDVLTDLESGRVMDRLVCGDVGYGKTEVAIRAAFRAVSDGRQVAVLVPTTVLAFQHEQSFRARLRDYPMTVESVSRFKSAGENKKVLERLAQGKVDVIVGTHRLLSRDVAFRDLALVIVDEEHRFGVEHKEKLKAMKVDTHVLTLTATPIPRTLHMALSGLRDISLINTPPVDRLPIRTYVSKYDEALIQKAVAFELGRGGQVFFLHNRVETIQDMANTIAKLVPEARVGIGHGQMGEGALEETMVAFYEKRTNVLVCTTIIESGIDLPNANTILINRADALGLAQLYQIRGRVGRGQARAYAYLMIPAETAVSDDAKKRLEVLQRFVELGSGFSIASHDLEIRGGGDLLGAQQSGHIAAVGFDLYTELLEEAIRELEGQPLAAPQGREPEIKTPFPAFLSEEYVPDVHQRLSLYRRLSASADDAEIDQLEAELKDRFGAAPPEAENLLWLIRIKAILKKAGVDALTVGPERVVLVSGAGSQIDPVRAISLVSGHPGVYQITPDSKFVAKLATSSLRDLFFALGKLLGDLRARV